MTRETFGQAKEPAAHQLPASHLRPAFIADKDLRKLLALYPNLRATHAKRHLKIYSLLTLDFVIAPVSGSDWRGLRNLRSDLERLSSSGEGYLARAAATRTH